MHQFGDERINSYICEAFTHEQRSRGSLPRSREEFINAVWGEIAVKLGEGHVEPVTKEEMSKLLEDFEGRIRDGMEPEVFKDLPERKILMYAIRKVIDANRPPRRKREKYTGDFQEIAGGIKDPQSPNPATTVELAERAYNLHEALRGLDAVDQKILGLFMSGQTSQTQIAQSLSMPLQTVNRRFKKAIARLKHKLQWCRD